MPRSTDRAIVPPPRPLKGITLPLEQLWDQGLEKAVQLDVLNILSRIAARPATRKAERPHEPSPAIAPARARATSSRATNLRNAVSKENADD